MPYAIINFMSGTEERFDVALVGGGIVGLSVARALRRAHPGLRLGLFEKERRLGAHQTGHNSGVIHSGAYYPPGSLKARLCRSGAQALLRFCEAEQIPTLRCGKVIIAVEKSELDGLERLHRRALENGLPEARLVDGDRLRELEPAARGLRALHLPSVAVVDFSRVAEAIARRLREGGVAIRTGCEVRAIRRDGRGRVLETSRGAFSCRFLINCAGLHADRLARADRSRSPARIIPFRGEYYSLQPPLRDQIRGLIYPVPDARLPFLGVHLTRTVGAAVEVGPNAVLALAREGYSRADFSLKDCREMLAFRGFWRMAFRYAGTGAAEWVRSRSVRRFAAAAARLVPGIRPEHLVPSGSGIRAQAVDPTGELVHDFRIIQSEGALHLVNAPSPAATAALAIGEHIADRLQLTP